MLARYHIVGSHDGVWIMDVDSREELERLLRGNPCYNFSIIRTSAHAPADATDAGWILGGDIPDRASSVTGAERRA